MCCSVRRLVVVIPIVCFGFCWLSFLTHGVRQYTLHTLWSLFVVATSALRVWVFKQWRPAVFMDTSYYSDSSASPAGGGAVAGSSSGGYGALGAAHSGSLQSGLSTLSSSMSVSSQGGGGTLRRGTMGKSKSGFRLSSLSFSRGHKSADRSTEPKEDSVGKRFFCLFSLLCF